MSLKAYKLHCRDDDHGADVVFAENSRAASKRNYRDACDCEFIDKLCHRAPAFDKYAPGPVTIEQCFAEGWVWPCACCEHNVWSDQPYLIIDSEQARWVFCNEQCLRESHARSIDGGYAVGEWHWTVKDFANAVALKVAELDSTAQATNGMPAQ